MASWRRSLLTPALVSQSERRPQSPMNPPEKARRKPAPRTIPCSAVQNSLEVNSIAVPLNPTGTYDAALNRSGDHSIVIRYSGRMLKSWIGSVKRRRLSRNTSQMKFTHRSIAAAAFFILLLSAQFALAGPPFITDDPDPVEYKHWEAYLFTIYNHTQHTNFGQYPAAIELNYGAIPDVQLHLIAPIGDSRDEGGNDHFGYGDTELGAKYRFIKETDYLPEVGTFPLIELPTGDASRGLGNGYTQVFIPIWMQKTFGADKKWMSFGGGGFWYNPGDDHRNYFRLGWELQRDLSEHLTLGGEIYHETSSAHGVPGHTAFNLGGYVNIDDPNHVLFSVGRDINGPVHVAFYLGYQVTY